MSSFGVNLKINKNQMLDAVLQRVTDATQVAAVNTRGQLGYNDTIEKIIYFDGTAIRILASETYVNSQITANTLTVAPSSANLIDITANQISLKALGIQKVNTDTNSTTLTLALAARTPVYNLANVTAGTADLQEGDVLILALATGGMQIVIHNGGTAGTTADFTVIETPNLDNAAIRALFGGSNGVTYNSATGVFQADESHLTNNLYNFFGGITRDPLTKNVFLSGNLTGGRELVIATSTFNIRNSRGNGYGLWLNNNALNTFARFGDSTVNLERNDSGMEFKGLDVLGVTYATPPSTPTNNTLMHKGYVDSIAVKRSTQTVTTVAATPLVITHNFSLADKDSIQVSVYKGGVQFFVDVETVSANTIRITTSQAEVGLKVFMIA